jgi:hypothetical protein
MEALIPKGYPIEMNLDKNHTNIFLKITIPSSG